MSKELPNFAVFASGNGGNLQAIIDAVKAKKIKATLALVFSDKSDAYALVRAKKAKIPTLHLNPKEFKDRLTFDAAVLEELKAQNIDFLVFAGYMRLISPNIVAAFPNRILNVHPALLPSFKGAHGIRDAIEAGVKVTGVTVHFVVDEVDAGAIIMQEAVPITPKDDALSLAKKIHAVEHIIYPKAIDLFARGKIKINGPHVTILK